MLQPDDIAHAVETIVTQAAAEFYQRAIDSPYAKALSLQSFTGCPAG